MRLSTKEADVLAAVELRASMRVDEIREELGYRAHTVRYALSSLRQRQIIWRLPFINVRALGYTIHNLYISVGSEKKSHRQSFLAALLNEPEVLRISELGSEYQYGLEVCAKNLSDVGLLVRRIASQFEHFHFEKAVASQLATTYLPRRYLSSKMVRSKPLQIARTDRIFDVDEIDEKILRVLARGGEMTRAGLAREVAVPVTTLDARLKRLESRGIVGGYIYHVVPAAYQMQSHTLLLQMRNLNRETLNKLFVFAEQHPAVVRITECFGSWDFELGIEVRLPSEVAEVQESLYEAIGDHVHLVKSLCKYRDLKVQFYPVKQERQNRMSAAA
ncbi:MAG: winged helix-turn-helix transcriptional regulator [Bdellovibrionales bacterium]|nr:winged helix-turn-helix transcriptional regulator [Bdellovibrionales bacterium]